MNERSDTPRDGRPVGVGYAVLSAMLFGLSTPASKALLPHIHPALLAGAFYLGAGIGLGAIRLVTRRERAKGLRREHLPRLAITVLVGGVAAPLLLLVGLRVTPASSASLLLNLETVFTVLLAWRIFGEHVSARIALGMAFIVGAGVLLAWQRGATGLASGWGPLAIAGTCLCWATDNNVTRAISDADTISLVTVKGLASGATNLAIAFALGAHVPTIGIGVAALALGFVSYGLSLLAFVLALRNLGSTRTSAYFATAPFLGAALALAVLHEPIGPRFVPAAALMAVGLWLHLTEEHAHEHRHAATRHTHAHTHDEHHQHVHAEGIAAIDGHTHEHEHEALVHSHAHYPDIHHRHEHE